MKDPLHDVFLDTEADIGSTCLGLMMNHVWHDDPRRLLFVLSRYKFVAKMLSGKASVGEVGCGDAFGTRIVQQEVERVVAYDIEPVFIRDINLRQDARWHLEAVEHDILRCPLPQIHDAIYSLDVIEHIPRVMERRFVHNLHASLDRDSGVLIIGTPSAESASHASEISKAGHINLKSGRDLRLLVEPYFHNVFSFSMNDEVVHTGFAPMSHYNFIVCAGPK